MQLSMALSAWTGTTVQLGMSTLLSIYSTRVLFADCKDLTQPRGC